jgi:hypothetical protein
MRRPILRFAQDDDPFGASRSTVVDSAPMTTALRLRAACLTAGALLLVVSLAGCQDAGTAAHRADSIAAASAAAGPVDATPAPDLWVMRPIVVAPDSVNAPQAAVTRGDSAGADTTHGDSARADTTAHDSAKSVHARRRPLKLAKGERRRYALTPADSARWPVKGPEPAPGALLPEHLIIAYYGNPKSTRMGILGQLPPNEMLPKLERTAREWAEAEPGRKVVPALHLIATVAQGKPGSGGKYRLRHSDQLIEQVLGWAKERGWLVFLDVQTGHSTVADELPHLVKYLELPYVHLALDPEFAMKLGGVPGQRIGTLDATDINLAVQLLADIVEKKKVPPKVLVVHRFTQRMLTNHDQIKLDPRVQVVVDMDGFGAPWLKEDAYKFFIAPEPVQFTGFKLFYKNDKPMMSPERVLELWPSPVYIQYQ